MSRTIFQMIAVGIMASALSVAPVMADEQPSTSSAPEAKQELKETKKEIHAKKKEIRLLRKKARSERQAIKKAKAEGGAPVQTPATATQPQQ